jgi:hypothetical protein
MKEASPTILDCSLYSHRATFMLSASKMFYKTISVHSPSLFMQLIIIDAYQQGSQKSC